MRCMQCNKKNDQSDKNCSACGFPLYLDLDAFRTLAGGRYRIEKLLGKGGMSLVLLGFDQERKRNVAIKLLMSDTVHGENIDRFRREFKAIKTLKHPNIIEVYDFITVDNYFFYIMEYIEGESLRDIIDGLQMKDIVEDEFQERFHLMASYICQLCLGLDYMHKQGVIHRDIKPSNIMVSQDKTVKLMDFGLVKSRDFSISLTRTGIISGTVAYMSPEQAMGKELDIRTDLYSLGVLLFELFTDSLPFYDENPINLLLKHINQPATVPSTLNALIPHELDRVILKCLNKDPQLRYSSARVVHDQLLRLADKMSLSLESTDRLDEQDSITKTGIQNLLLSPCMGRQKELVQIKKILKAVDQGKGQVLVVTGKKGSGKTRLIEEIKNDVLAKNLRFFRGIAFSKDDLPYRPFTEIVEQFARYASIYDEKTVVDINKNNMLPINQIIRLSSRDIDKTRTDNIALKSFFIENRNRIFQIFENFFATLSKNNPLVLFIDNIYRADENSLELFVYLASRLKKSKLLLVCTTTPDGLSDESMVGSTESIFDFFERNKMNFHSIGLDGLSEHYLTEMIKHMLGLESIPTQISSLLFRRSAGLPGIAQETLKNLIADGAFIYGDNGWTLNSEVVLSLPENFEELLHVRLQRLEKEQLEFLTIASIFGSTFEVPLLVEFNRFSSEDVARLVFNLVKEGFIEEIQTSTGDYYSFRHDEIRDYLYSAINSDEKRRLHLTVLEIYLDLKHEQQEEIADKLFYHAQNGEGDTTRAAYFARLAGDRYVKQYALQSAKFFYLQAESILSSLPMKTVEMLELYMVSHSLAHLFQFLSLFEFSIKRYLKALELAKKLEDYQLIIECLISIAQYYRKQKDERKSLMALTKAKKLAQKGQMERELAQTLSIIGDIESSLDNHEQAIEALSESLRIFRQLGEKNGELQALVYYGRAYSRIGERKNALELFTVALDIAQESELFEYQWQCHRALISELMITMQLEKAIESAKVTIQFCKKRGTKRMIAESYLLAGRAYFWYGDHTRAISSYSIASSLYAELDKISEYITTRRSMAWNHLYLSEYQKAMVIIEELYSHYVDHLRTEDHVDMFTLLAQIYGQTGLKNMIPSLEQKLDNYFSQLNLKASPYELLLVIGDFKYHCAEFKEAEFYYSTVLERAQKFKFDLFELVSKSRLEQLWIINRNKRESEGTEALINQLEGVHLHSTLVFFLFETGQSYYASEKFEIASAYISRANSIAAEMNIPYYFWRSSLLRANLYQRENEELQAIPHYRDAQRVINKIVTNIKPKYRKTFITWEPVQDLLQNIERIDKKTRLSS